MTTPDPTQMNAEVDPNDIPVDFQEMMDHATSIQAKVIADMTKDLAAQRAVSTALQKRVGELREEIKLQQQVISDLEEKLNPSVKDLEHAEAVLDKIIEEASPSTNGDKPAAKEVPSPQRSPRPPVKETIAR